MDKAIDISTMTYLQDNQIVFQVFENYRMPPVRHLQHLRLFIKIFGSSSPDVFCVNVCQATLHGHPTNNNAAPGRLRRMLVMT